MPRPRRRIAPPRYPFGAELAHRRALYALVTLTRDAALEELRASWDGLLIESGGMRQDQDEGTLLTEALAVVMAQGVAATLEAMLTRIAQQVVQGVRDAASAVMRAGRLAEATNRREWFRVIRQAYGVNVLRGEPDLPALLSLWEQENLALIRSLPENMISQLRGEFAKGLVGGKGMREMSRIVRERADVASSRADLIARDQIGKLNGQLARYRQTRAGVREYVWRTMQDERVRPEHRARDGKTFRWDRSPIPGEEIRCRCVADPVLPDFTQTEVALL